MSPDIVPPPDPQTSSPPTVLLVDDNERVRVIVRDWLETVFPKFRFLEASSGEQGFAMAGQYGPDLVLMDIALSRMSGLEAARMIVSHLPGTKVIMLTNHVEDRYREEAEEIGVSGFVSKAEMASRLVPAIQSSLSAHGLRQGREGRAW